MKKLVLAMIIGAVAVPSAVSAKHHDRDYRNDRRYSESERRDYKHHCGGGNGAVGTVAGGVGGALVGDAVGGGTLGTVAGGVGGALLGRHLDKKHTRDKNDC